jgi:adenylate cyclase
MVARPLDWIRVEGKKEAIQVYALLGLRNEVSQALVDQAALHARALECYRRQDWPEAAALFEQLLQIQPGDGPAALMLGRCRQYQAEPPGADWDGVYRAASK